MKITNIKGYKSVRSNLTVLALNLNTGIIIQGGENFEINKVYFDFYSFNDKTEWKKLGNKKLKKLYNRWLKSSLIK